MYCWVAASTCGPTRCSGRVSKVKRAPSGFAPFRYLPLNMPRAKGDQASKPTSSCMAISLRSCSKCRHNKEYSFWIDAILGKLLSFAICNHLLIPQAVSLDKPIWRIFPAWISSFSTVNTSKKFASSAWASNSGLKPQILPK